MIALDTNLLVYAHRPEFPWHVQAKECIRTLAEGTASWAIPFHCLVEFAATVSHPRKFLSPSSPAQVQDQIAAWRESPSLHILSDSADSLKHWLELILNRHVQGPHHHDARIVAVCLSHGIKELWTADRDYLRYPELPTRNPLVG